MSPRPPRRVGLIGHGRIGHAVAQAIVSGRAGGWELAAVLTRGDADMPLGLHHTDPFTFFRVPVDLYLECAGPQALALLGEDALQRADVWSVSAAALADDAVYLRLESTGARTGHRLRLVAGAAGGLDAVGALAGDPHMRLEVAIVAPERCASFASTVRAAATHLPLGVNLAVAAALAGPGLDRTTVQVTADPDMSHHAITVRASSALGSFESRLLPVTDAARHLHVVAASLVAALRQADQVVWVG